MKKNIPTDRKRTFAIFKPPLLNQPGQLHPAVQLGLIVEAVIIPGAIFPVDNQDVAPALVLDDFILHFAYLRYRFWIVSLPLS